MDAAGVEWAGAARKGGITNVWLKEPRCVSPSRLLWRPPVLRVLVAVVFVFLAEAAVVEGADADDWLAAPAYRAFVSSRCRAWRTIMRPWKRRRKDSSGVTWQEACARGKQG